MGSSLLQIQFIAEFISPTLSRQLSAEQLARDNVRFCFGDENIDHCDYCVVYGGLPARFNLTMPRHRTIFVSGEPTSFYRYPKNFLAQFGTVITTDRYTRHPNCLFMQAGLPWEIGSFAGVGEYRREPMTIDTFRTYMPRKHKLISVICSNKDSTRQHGKRLSFAARLRKHFGDRLDVFGRGVNTFADKEEAIAPYRYHIVLENSSHKDYWTEKISDPILALTYPIYYGCENLDEYLPDSCFTRINIAQPKQAIEIIESTIASDKAETSQEALRRARDLILDKHNIFALLTRMVKKLHSSPTAPDISEPVTVRPHWDFDRNRHRLHGVSVWVGRKYRAVLRKARIIRYI